MARKLAAKATAAVEASVVLIRELCVARVAVSHGGSVPKVVEMTLFSDRLNHTRSHAAFRSACRDPFDLATT